MRNAAYFLAAVPEPVTCLGVKLKPLTLGHVILLHRFESRFVIGGQPDLEDLILSLVICSREYADAIRLLDSSRCKWLLKWWGFKAWLAIKAGHDLVRSMLQFKYYYETADKIPKFEIEDNDGNPISTPFVLSVKLALQSGLHQSEEEALNKPWGMALFEYIAHRSIAKGDLRILSGEEYQEFQDLKAKANNLDMDKLSAIHRRATGQN